MKNIFLSVRTFVYTHKKISAVLVVVMIGGLYWYGHGTAPVGVQYGVVSATRASITSSVTGSGQVSASNRVDIVPEVSGKITAIPVSIGQNVVKGQVLITLDSGDASRTVDNAELSLENARISYEKAQREFANQATSSEVSDIRQSYKNGYTAVADTFIDLSNILDSVNDLYYNPNHSPYFSDINLRTSVNDTALQYKNTYGLSFDQVKRSYNQLFATYRSMTNNSPQDQITALIQGTYDLTQSLSTTLVGTYNTIDYTQNHLETIPNQLTSDKTQINGFISTVNDHTSKLSSALTAIEDAKGSATDAELSMKSAELAVKQAEATLSDAQDALTNHTIRADFDGIIAEIPAEVGDTVSQNTTLLTLITKQKMAEISLNEVDAARVHTGQSAQLSFDAFDDLSIAGTVTKVDLLGTVSQGVVSYTVDISFHADDTRVKPGMTVNADITTDQQDNVIVIPSAAVKTVNGKNFVQIFSPSVGQPTYREKIIQTTQVPKSVQVQTGISNDTEISVTSGLQDGDEVITRTLATSTTIIPSASSAGTTRNTGTGGTTRTGGALNFGGSRVPF